MAEGQGMTAAARLRQLAEAATPGPWHSHPHDVFGDNWSSSVYFSGRDPQATPRIVLARADGPDAAYIAALNPTVALLLADVVDAAEALLEAGEIALGVQEVARQSGQAGLFSALEPLRHAVGLGTEALAKLQEVMP